MGSSKEFDAFGPWVLPVRTGDEVPPLFRPVEVEPEAMRLVLKVPRGIERRDANPSMDLYDFLIAVGDELLTILHRNDVAYDVLQLPFDQIVAIEDSVRLLDGRLTLRTATGLEVTIPYNGSSAPLIGDLVRLLRDSYLPFSAEPGPDVERREPFLGPGDGSLVVTYRDVIKREPGMRVVHAFGRRIVTPDSGPFSPIVHRLRPITMHAAIALTDDREILVLHRRDPFTPVGDDHSAARTIVPRARITAAGVERHPRYRDVGVVTVGLDAVHLNFFVPDGPELTAFLEALGVSRAQAR
ncbi:hypothetical protein [Actinoplanes sp. HUAS TT8]|uniref:hypothetical protein n=1 Tax=Actinoplanes sp. HUAS TT8 TaxID=3447453 RepID=UPI003F522079